MSVEAPPQGVQRFIAAQERDYDQALCELRKGQKISHWMWYIFPQIAGLGRSPTAQFYAIADLEEAQAYLTNPLLGPRLVSCVEALLHWANKRTAEQIMGPVDALKLRSSLTLFEQAAFALDLPPDPFAKSLKLFYGDKRDARTLALLAQ